MSAKIFERSGTQVMGSTGAKSPGAIIYFYNAGTTTPRTVYSDSALSIPLSHPVPTSAYAIVPAIYLPYGDYRVRTETALGAVLSDFDGVSNPEPSTGGGGGGGDVPLDERIQTGDVIWSLSTGARTGFVRMNARSIGSATSGASERANPDTEALFTFLWNNVANAYCPVSGGRGATAAADFAANKTLTLPEGRGRALWGLDDMGNNAANVSQVSTTITTTNSSTTATVGSNSGLAIGMTIVSANVQTGTTVTNISGSTITLSLAASGTASAVAARFSPFSDAQQPGAVGGAQTRTLVQQELSTNLGTALTEIFNGTTVVRGFQAVLGGGTTIVAGSQTSDITAATSIINALGGHPHITSSPGVGGTHYMKL